MKKNKLITGTILLIILLIGFYLRLKDGQELFFWLIDEDTMSLIAKRIVIDHRPILIGGDIPGGLYTGPAFYYLTALIYWIWGMNPTGLVITAALVGTATVGALFLVTKKLFNLKIAIVASALYAVSTLTIVYAHGFSTLTFGPLCSLVIYYSLIKIIQERKWKWIYPLVLALILVTHSEGTGFSLLALVILSWIWFKLPVKKKDILLGTGMFLFSFFPLVLFDLRHDFHQVKAFGKFLGGEVANNLGGTIFDPEAMLRGVILLPKNLIRLLWLTGPLDVSKQIVPCDFYRIARENLPLFLIIIAGFLILIGMIRGLKNKEGLMGKILGLHCLIMLLGVMLYNAWLPGYTNEWFFMILWPAMIIMIARWGIYLAKKEWLRGIIIGLLGIVLVTNVQKALELKNEFGLKKKLEAVEKTLGPLNGKSFALNSGGECFGYGGWEYLFWFKGQEPVKSYIDPVYQGWLYDRAKDKEAEFEVTLISEDQIKINLSEQQ